MKSLLQPVANKIIELAKNSTNDEEFHAWFMIGMHFDNFALNLGIQLD